MPWASNAIAGLDYPEWVMTRHGKSKAAEGQGKVWVSEYHREADLGFGWPDGQKAALMIQEGEAD